MHFDFTAIQAQAQEEIAKVAGPEDLERLRIKYLGRRGLLAEITSAIPSLEISGRPEAGRKVNNLKNKLSQLLEEKTAQLKARAAPGEEYFDISLPGHIPRIGTFHPISSTLKEVCAIFSKLGFAVVEGPELETEYNNFTGLNIPLEHPSRDAFDTFYLNSPVASRQLKAEGRQLLRSHTSPVQVRVMKKYKPPLAVVVPGKVYRPDAVDAAHSFMFHQVEGFLVDTGVRFSDLKGVLTTFAKRLFGPEIKMRFRPHFFPFTEPSAEVDISCIICRNRISQEDDKRLAISDKQKCSVCGGKGWLEVLGCGIIHPKVFQNVGYPLGKYTGFAFGLGVERIAMLRHGIDDIRLFFENDLRFLRQF